MKRSDNNSVNFIISFLLACFTFGVVFLGVHWNLLLSGAITLAVYGASVMLLPLVPKSVDKRKHLNITGVKINEETQRSYTEAVDHIDSIRSVYPKIKNIEIRQLGEQIVSIGDTILQHLSSNYEDLSASQYFLSYWVPQSHDILSNYQNLEQVSLSADKMREASDNTKESLTQLLKVFVKQRDGFYEEAVRDTKITRQLLDRTVKMQEDMMLEESSNEEQ